MDWRAASVRQTGPKAGSAVLLGRGSSGQRRPVTGASGMAASFVSFPPAGTDGDRPTGASATCALLSSTVRHRTSALRHRRVAAVISGSIRGALGTHRPVGHGAFFPCCHIGHRCDGLLGQGSSAFGRRWGFSPEAGLPAWQPRSFPPFPPPARTGSPAPQVRGPGRRLRPPRERFRSPAQGCPQTRLPPAVRHRTSALRQHP